MAQLVRADDFREHRCDVMGTLLCAQSMVLAAYLIHEAAHQTLFTSHRANHATGEALNFIAGSSYASFDRIQHMHIRHHVDRAISPASISRA